MAVEYTRRKRFYFRYTWHLRLVSGSLGHLEIALSLIKNFWGSWKNSGTFYRYSSCFVWSSSDGPQFGWTGRAFYRKLSSAAKTYSLYKVPVICLCVFNPRIKTVLWWIHIEDIFTIDAEFVLDKWTVINDDTNFLQSKRSTRSCWNTSYPLRVCINARKHCPCKKGLTSLHGFYGSRHLCICCSLFGHRN